MIEPKILLLDIETAPNLGYVWGKWEQNVIEFLKDWYILSFSVKWFGDALVETYALPDFPRYKTHKEDDGPLVRKLWEFFNAADIIVAHNAERFDLRKSNSRFIAHRLNPPSPYRVIDTLKIARKHFAFDSNKLDDLGQYLKVGRKIPHTGKHLWLGCMYGDLETWDVMRQYNAHDVELLERVYLKLRPWAANHPNLNLYTRRTDACPACQATKIAKDGCRMTRTGKRQRFLCGSCGFKFDAGPLIRLEPV